MEIVTSLSKGVFTTDASEIIQCILCKIVCVSFHDGETEVDSSKSVQSTLQKIRWGHNLNVIAPDESPDETAILPERKKLALGDLNIFNKFSLDLHVL